MGAEASAPRDGVDSKGSLVSEILKLKAAKASGWLTEEEFVVEVKRVVQEFNGESREPAYAGLEQTVMDTISDEAQMAEWEAKYGSEAAAVQPAEAEGAGRPAPLVVEEGSVELSLTGGIVSPKQSDLEKELEEMGAQVEDMSMSGGGADGAAGEGAAGEGAGEGAAGEGEGAVGEGGSTEQTELPPTPLSPTIPTRLAPPSDDFIDESPARAEAQ